MSSPTLVQYADSNTLSVAFGSPVTQGNFLVCIGTNGAIPTDTLNNAWQTFQKDFVFDFTCSVSVCPASKSTGANTVSTGTGVGFLAVAEFSPSVIQAQTDVVTGGISADIAGAINQLLVGMCQAPVSGNTISGVGSGFTQPSGSFTNRISLEYEALAASGSVSSAFTTTGTSSRIGTSAFTLSAPPVVPAQTPSIVQAGRINFTNNVAKGNSMLVVAFPLTTTATPALNCNDNLGNVYAPIAASAVSGFFASATPAYCFASYFFCAASVASGACSVSLSGPTIAISETWLLELTPCAVAAFSLMASGTVTGADVTSSPISVSAAQLLVDFAVLNQAVTGIIGMPCAGFQAPLTPSGGAIGSPWNALATQPVIANGSYNSDFNVCKSTSLGFTGPYVTGIIALGSTYSISGNAGIAGPTVSYSGTASGSVVADGSGNFTIPGLLNGSYTITPSFAGNTFSPNRITEIVNGSNITGVNFSIAAPTLPTGGFSPNWYEGQRNAGLAVYISPGGFGGVSYNGQLVLVPANSTSYLWLANGTRGVIQVGPSLPDNAYGIAIVVSGPIITTGINQPGRGNFTTDPGIQSITDIRSQN
jgi:hypothetical protein